MLKKTNKLSKSELELEFEIKAEEFNTFVEKALQELSKELEVKGFRKGNVPKEIAKEHIKKEAVLSLAAEKAAQKEYSQYVLENEIEPISAPELNVLKLAEGNNFVFKIKVALLPVLELPDYKKIAKKVEKKSVEVKDSEVKQTLEWLQKKRAKRSNKEGEAEKKDLVEIEYWSEPTGEQKDAFLLGEGRLMPGFEDVIIGMKAGEEKKDVKIKVPQDHPTKEIAGKEITFKIKVNSVSKMEIPELNDEFAKNIGQFESLQALKDNIKQGIKQEKEQGEKQRKRGEILEKIAEETRGEISKILIEKERETLLSNMKKQIKERMNLSFEDYLKQVKKTEKEVFDSLEKEAEKRVKEFLILKQMAEKEKIEPTEKEIKEETDKFLKKYQNAQEAEKDIDSEKLKVYTKETVKNEKILQLLENL